MIAKKAWIALAALAAASGAPARAVAQQWLMGGEATIGSGLEGGGDPRGVVRRARTTARLGFDARVDENPAEIWSGGVLMEVEPRTTFGVDFHYGRLVSPRWTVDAGAIGFLLPETLFGVTAGAMMHDKPGRGVQLEVGPRANVFFLGSDLPTSRPIWQVMICGGVHVDF